MENVTKLDANFKAYARPRRATVKNKQDNATKWVKNSPVGCPVAKVILFTLAGLRNSRGIATLSHAEIAEYAECSVMTVRRKLIQLETAGYIKRYRRHNKRGQRASDSYFLATHREDLEPIKPLKRVAKIKQSSVPGSMNLAFPMGSIPSVPLRNELLIDRPVKVHPGKDRSTLPGLPSIALVSSLGSISHVSLLASRLKSIVSSVPSRPGGLR